MHDWVRRLEEAWRLAESTRPTDAQGIVMEDLGLELSGGHVRAGADAAGFRHLLFPVDDNEPVEGVLDGKAIILRRRPLVVEDQPITFAALTCTRGELFPEFSTLAADILGGVEQDSDQPLRVVRGVLADWRELLRSLGGRGLSRNGVTGLYGELLVLEEVVLADPRRRSDCWTGADAQRHDFQRGPVIVEAKTTTVRRGRPCSIHGIDQLQTPPGADLYLRWTRLEAAVDRGDSLRTLVDRLSSLVSDVADFTRKLEGLGYRPQEPEDYAQPRFTQLDSAYYRVADTFPRLSVESFVGGRLPAGITGVSYELELTSETPLADGEARSLISQLAGLQ